MYIKLCYQQSFRLTGEHEMTYVLLRDNRQQDESFIKNYYKWCNYVYRLRQHAAHCIFHQIINKRALQYIKYRK